MILELDIIYGAHIKHFRWSEHMKIGDAAQEACSDFGIELRGAAFKDRHAKLLGGGLTFNREKIESGEMLELVGVLK